MVALEFILFGLILLGIALFHKRSMQIALGGMLLIAAYKAGFLNFSVRQHLVHEAWQLLNLAGLLLGFALLADYFHRSRADLLITKILPDDWRGPLFLLCIVAFLSAFLDNIAGAMIGGTIASEVFKKKVHIGYVAAIVAAANAGGAGSVIGDTTTTMIWLAGVSAIHVLPAVVGTLAALAFFAPAAALQQHRLQPIMKDPPAGLRIDYVILFGVGAMLLATIGANLFLDLPALGLWLVLLIFSCVRPVGWHALPEAFRSSVFLLSLVIAASMMPVDELPAPSWLSCFGLGIVSAVFDNIPLTKLTLAQGGYDWPLLAFAVGYGGSLTWFGSSAGVAISGIFPEARSLGAWIKASWHVAIGYVLGFFALLLALELFNPANV